MKHFAENMWVAFAVQKLLTFFQQKISEYCLLNPLKQLTKWPLTSSLSWRRFEQLGPAMYYLTQAESVRVTRRMTFIHQVYETGRLTLNILWANSADDKLMTFFLIFPENRLWDNLYEMSKPIFWKKK